MCGMGRLRGILSGLLVGAFCLCLFAQWAEGQVNPTPEQLQMFQGLTPEQQQSIRNALGGTGQTTGGASDLGSRRPGELGPADQQEQMRQERRKSTDEEEEPEPKSPIPA